MIRIYNSLSASSETELKKEKSIGKDFMLGLFLLFCMLYTGLTATAQVSVTATAGTPGPTPYSTVKDAFDAINSGTHQGAITISLSGNTTETASAVLNSGEVAPAVYTSVSITATTPVTISGAIVGAIIKLNGADNVTIDGRIGGTGRNITVQNTSTAAATAAVWLASVAALNGCTNNVIRNLELACGANQSTGTNSTFGIIMCGTTVSVTANGLDNDNNTFTENRIIRCRYGITTRGTTTDLNQSITVTNNIIGPASFGADEIGKDGIFMQFDNLATISGNTVQFVGGQFGDTTGGTDRVGIAIGIDGWSTSLTAPVTGTNYKITNNSIHDIVDERTFSAVGILLGVTNGTSVTKTLAANNVIYNVRSNGTAGDQTVGIAIAGGLGDTVANNSISLTGDVDPSSGATATSMFGSGIRIGPASSTSHTDLQLLNNSVYIDLSSSSTAAARYYAISGNAAAYSFGTGGQNYNNYYINPTNPQVQTGGLGTASGTTLTTQFATLANWQVAYTTPQDANSIQSNPLYGSTSDLHIGPTSPNIDAGTEVTSVTTDFDGDTRPLFVAYDIGADEFNGTFTDITPPTITAISIVGNSCGLTSRTVTATISDVIAVDTGGNAPRIYFRKNAGAYSSAAGTLTSGTVASGTWTFTITYATLGGVVPTDVIDYFIVAQDGAGNPTGNPVSGLVLTNVNTVTTNPTTPLTYSIQNVISGTYTVGVGGNYATLTAAAAAYNSSCLGGAVVFSLTDASYAASETFPITFNANLDASAVNTLTIRPAVSNTATITGAVAAGSLIKLNGADYVTIDGSNSGGSTRNLSIINTTTTATGNAVVWLASPAVGNGATNNTVKNTIIEGSASTTSFLGVFIGGNATITLTAAGSERNNNNTVTNCLFRKTQYGLATFGFAAGSPDQNLVITNNTFGTATVGEGFNISGINSDRTENLLVSGNEVQNVKGTSTTAMYGMRLLDFKSGICRNNKVHDVAFTGTSTTARVYGIGVASSTYTLVDNPSLALIANNFVYAINSSSTSTTWNTTGILASAGYGDRYYHNTVNMSGQLSNSTSGLSAAFANGNPSVTAICNNIDVRNNIFNVSGSTSGGNVWAYYTQATNFTGATENYNLLRAAATGTTNNTGRFNATNYATLALWQAATGISANDTDIAPVFTSATDLHLDAASNGILNGLGFDLTATVPTDIDGDVRPSSPDMGADEFTISNCIDANGGTASGSISNCGPITNPSISATGYSIGLNGTYQWMSSTSALDYPNSGTIVSGQTTPTVLTTGLVAVTTYYWLRVTCATNTSTAYSNMVTITIQGPEPTIVSGAGTFCESTTISASGGTGGTIYFQGTTSNGTSTALGGSPQTITTSGTYYFRSFDGTCWGAQGSVAVIVIPNPTGVTATASVTDACNGVPFDLFSTPATPPATILQQNFETGLAPWTAVNTSTTTGTGNPALVIWAQQTTGYAHSTDTFTAPEGTKFAMANADAGGSGVTAFTTLTSPGFNTLGYTTLSLSFKQYYRNLTNAAAFVEVSTNGTVWTTVQSYNATQGTAAAFASASVNLDAYVGNANLYVRFRHSGGWEWYWAVDDVAISGTPVPYTYSWTSVPAGFTSSDQNPTGVTQSVPRTYKVRVTGTGGCFTESTVSVGQAGCSSIVNLKLFIEGYYEGPLMRPVKNNQDGVSPTDEVEDITVELHDTASPYGVLHTTTATLKTDGTAVCSFATAPSGSFYIAVTSSNALETWSATPQTVGGTPLTYDFTNAITKSYEDNMIDVGGVFAFFSGDINQDDVIDGSDAIDLDLDVFNSEFGVRVTDLNGDGSVDGSDVTFFENNQFNSVFAHYPQ